MLVPILGVSPAMLLIVPLGPTFRFWTLARDDFADCAVRIDTTDDVRSAPPESVSLRPLTELAFAFWVFPATIFSAQLAIETDEDRRLEPSPPVPWLCRRRKAGTAVLALSEVGGTKRSFGIAFRGALAPLFARDLVWLTMLDASLSTILATEGALLLFLLALFHM